MKKLFTTDIPLKLLSLGLAIFLWVYLVVLLNPQIEASITAIPITYSDHSTLTKNGYVITNEAVETVSLKLRGSRNMLANVNKNNISAYIDLSGCSEAGSYSLPVHVRLPYDELSIIDKAPYNVTVVVDKIIERDFDLNIITRGELKDKIHIDNLKADVEYITVRGPSEIVKSIDSVAAYFDVSGLADDAEKNADVVLLDNRGEKVENSFLTVSNKNVDIRLTVLNEKTVQIDTGNITVPKGFEISSIEHKEITLIGKKEILEAIESIKTENYEFTEETLIAEIPLMLPEYVDSKNKTVEIVIRETVTPQDENDNQ